MLSNRMCVQCLFCFPWDSCHSRNESQLLFVYFHFSFQTNWWWRKDQLCFKDLDVQELENVKDGGHCCSIHFEIWATTLSMHGESIRSWILHYWLQNHMFLNHNYLSIIFNFFCYKWWRRMMIFNPLLGSFFAIVFVSFVGFLIWIFFF